MPSLKSYLFLGETVTFLDGENVKTMISIWQMLGKIVQRWGRTRFYLPYNHFCKLVFSENLLVKEYLLFSKPESKLWYSKTVNKNINGAKM